MIATNSFQLSQAMNWKLRLDCAEMGGATWVEVIRRPLKTNKFEF
jgi:hypothetical protein